MKHIIQLKKINKKITFGLYFYRSQEMGHSKEYDNLQSAKKGIEELIVYLNVINNNIEDKHVNLIKNKDENHYSYQILDDNKRILYTSRTLEKEKNMINNFQSTCKNIPKAEVFTEIID